MDEEFRKEIDFEAEIQPLIDKGDYDSAQELVDKEIDKLNASSDTFWKRALHELRAQVLYTRGDVDDTRLRLELDHCKINRHKKDNRFQPLYVDDNKRYDFRFLDTALVLGSSWMREEGHLHKAWQAMNFVFSDVKQAGDEKLTSQFEALMKTIRLELAQQSESADSDVKKSTIKQKKGKRLKQLKRNLS